MLVCGQAETGKTTAVKNLMASLTSDATWLPKDISALTKTDFLERPEAFETRIEDRTDDLNRVALTYIIQVRTARC